MCCLHHTCSPAPPLQRLLFEAAEGGQTDRLTRLLDRCQQVGVSLSEWSDRRSISGVPQLHYKLKSESINQSAVDDWVRAGRWDEVRQTSPPPERPPVCLLKSHHVRKYQAAAAAEWPCSLSSSCPPSFCFCHFLFGFHFLPVCFKFPVGGRGVVVGMDRDIISLWCLTPPPMCLLKDVFSLSPEEKQDFYFV